MQPQDPNQPSVQPQQPQPMQPPVAPMANPNAYPQQMGQATALQDPGKSLSTVGLILAIFIPIVGIPLSIIGMNKSKAAGYSGKTGFAGIIVGIVSIIIGIVVSVMLSASTKSSLDNLNGNLNGSNTVTTQGSQDQNAVHDTLDACLKKITVSILDDPDGYNREVDKCKTQAGL